MQASKQARPLERPSNSANPTVIAIGGTHVGRVRDHNEDYFLIPDLLRDARLQEARRQRGELLVLADGMGGHAAGEVASRLAAERVMSGYYSNLAEPKAALHQAIVQANAEIYHAARRNAAQEGMGSTLVAALFLPDGRLLVAHVGDSRLYRLRNGELQQITMDHTWVNEQLRAGEISPDEAAHHRYRNVITRAMGASLAVQPEIEPFEPQPGDLYLLCSDGLSNMVTPEEIKKSLAAGVGKPAIEQLIGLANERGGPDNITVILASYGAAEADTVVVEGGSRPPLIWGAVAAIGVAVVLAAVLLLANGSELFPKPDNAAVGTPASTMAPAAQPAATDGSQVAAPALPGRVTPSLPRSSRSGPGATPAAPWAVWPTARPTLAPLGPSDPSQEAAP